MSQRKAKDRTIGRSRRVAGFGRGPAAPERDPHDPGDTLSHVWDPSPCVVMQCRIGELTSFLWVSEAAGGNVRLSFSETISEALLRLSPDGQAAVFDAIQEQAVELLNKELNLP